MKDFWNDRYQEDAYIYGTQPNAFFKANLPTQKGKLLLTAEGQGRNALYAALQGWEVTAFDYSEVAKQKAEKLFEKYRVKVDYQIQSFTSFQFEPNSFDCIALVFNHLLPEERKALHAKVLTYLKPNGVLLLEAFAKEQLGKSSGGPKNLEMLYNKVALQEDFQELKRLNIKVVTTTLEEGLYHQGEANVIRVIGQR